MDPARRIRIAQGVAIVAGLVPLTLLVVAGLAGRLGANPIEEITHETGQWTLRFLVLTLAVTPLRRVFGWRFIAPLRRTFGLFAFGYATLHMLTYVALDQFFDWALLWEDVLERPYVTAGFFAFLCLVPLAATSTRAMQRRLGRRWKVLHRLVYAAATAGVVHFLWLVKKDMSEPLLYAGIVSVLFALRLFYWLRRTRGASGPRGALASSG